MYYPYFLTYMLSGFVISLIVLFWALRNDQFKDQKRARFLPLEGGIEAEPVKTTNLSRIETYALIGLACSGLLASGAVLVFSLLTAGNG